MCDCVIKVNEALKASNGRLAIGIGITPGLGVVSRLLLSIEKADKSNRKKPPAVSASFCPFCGDKLGADVLAPAAQGQWVCGKCGTDRLKAACPHGHDAALTGQCPMVGTAAQGDAL